MDTLLRILPFAAAESLLIWGIWRLRLAAFIGSFLALLLAILYAVESEGSSEVFGLIGICVIVFGLSCTFLAERVGKAAFLSRSGLLAIGALLLFLGTASLFIL